MSAFPLIAFNTYTLYIIISTVVPKLTIMYFHIYFEKYQ